MLRQPVHSIAYIEENFMRNAGLCHGMCCSMMQMWHFRQSIFSMIAGVAIIAAAPGYAYDTLIEGAKMCTQYFPIKEREQQIPVHLLAAISTIETGRYHKGLDMALPWPWTINVEGQGHYYASKAEAIANTQAYLNQGIRSIDVGCMQVNLKHHPRAFANLNDAFDPAKNVDYAARFLQTNYQELGSWVKAAASYHSRTPSRGNPYLERVAKAWQTIVSKVQQAQARTGVRQSISDTTAHSDVAAAPGYKVIDASAPQNIRRPRQVITSTHGVRVISVDEVASSSVPKTEDTLTKTQTQLLVVPSASAQNSAIAAAITVDNSSPKTQSAQSNTVDKLSKNAHTNRTGDADGARPHFVFAE